MGKFLTTRKRSSFLLASVFAPVYLGILLSGGSDSTRQSSVKDQLKIVNKTKSIEVVDVHTEDPNLLVIVLKNVATTDINGFEVGVQHHARITGDSSIGGWAIAPGATYNLTIPSEYALSDITILAAMLTDGNIEGDAATIIHLKERRSELKRTLREVVHLIETALAAPDVNTLSALDKLESQITSLAMANEAVLNKAGGLRDAQSDFGTELQLLRRRLEQNGAQNQRRRLLDLKARTEKRIDSL